MINPRELEILNILWNSEEPMTSSQIVNVGDMLSQSTVQTVLRKLLKAKLVEGAIDSPYRKSGANASENINIYIHL